MEYQKRINEQLLGLQHRKDYIQENIPTNMIGGGSPLTAMGRIPSGNSTADLVLAGSVVGGSLKGFTKGFKRGFTTAGKDTLKTVKKIVKPVVHQVKKDYKSARKEGVGMLQNELSSGYEQGKQALLEEALGGGMKSISKGLSKTAKKVGKPVSKQVRQDVRSVKKDMRSQPSVSDRASNALMDVYTKSKQDLASYGGGRPSAWIQHVKAYQAKHGCSYKDAMKGAKGTYR